MDAQDLGIDVIAVIDNILQVEYRIVGSEAVMRCPNPSHDDQNPSFSVNLSSGLCSCFSCGFAADLIGLTSVVLNITRQAADELISPGSREGLIALLKSKRRTESQARHPSRNVLPGPYYPGPMNYLRQRGFSKETISAFGARFVRQETISRTDGSKFVIAGCIAIPIHDRTTKVGWVYRSTNVSPAWQPRYLYPAGTPIRNTWFGSQVAAWEGTVVVVEGPLDAMWVHQAGFQALACMGSSIKEPKARQLREFDRVLLFGDRDHAGRRFVSNMMDMLRGVVPLGIVRYPSSSVATDPCELTKGEVVRAVERAAPESDWRIVKKLRYA